MDTSNETSSAPEDNVQQPIPPVKKTSKKGSLICVLLIVILAAAAAGIYEWQHRKVTTLSNQVSTLQKQAPATSVNTTDKTTTQSGSEATDVSLGYPLALAHKEVLTTFHLPGDYRILQVPIQTTTQDELTQHHVNTFNDILASWQFSNKGTAASPSGSLTSNASMELVALNAWMALDDPKTVTYPSSGPNDTPAMTVAQKTAFANDLKTNTAACAKDSTKGFTTDDKVYTICYTLQHPQAEGADWAMDISGYANLSGAQLYLSGYLYLPNSYQSALAATIQALKHTTSVAQANPSNP